MTFEGTNAGELLNFIDERFGDKGCLLLEYKTIGVWNYEKMFSTPLPIHQRSYTIVYHKTDEGKCDIYLWVSGGYPVFDPITEKSRRDSVANEISAYATEQLKLQKTYDADESS
jgi:hypothetical protein